MLFQRLKENLRNPYALDNLDYAASNRTAGELRQKYMNDGATLLSCINPELILMAMKTKKFESMIVVQWETAENLVNNWSNLLEKTKHIRALLKESIE